MPVSFPHTSNITKYILFFDRIFFNRVFQIVKFVFCNLMCLAAIPGGRACAYKAEKERLLCRRDVVGIVIIANTIPHVFTM